MDGVVNLCVELCAIQTFREFLSIQMLALPLPSGVPFRQIILILTLSSFSAAQFSASSAVLNQSLIFCLSFSISRTMLDFLSAFFFFFWFCTFKILVEFQKGLCSTCHIIIIIIIVIKLAFMQCFTVCLTCSNV